MGKVKIIIPFIRIWHRICEEGGVCKKGIIVIGMLCLVLPGMARRHKPVVPDSLQVLEMEVNGIGFRMQRVEGGSYLMGATIEQTDRDILTNKPAHLVFLSPYYIATTEVTVQLWRAVMPEGEVINPKGYPTVPISYVTWNECQEFVRRLDSITGLPLNEADSVGWTYSCSGNWKHPVGRKRPNELGLYDMTGNVSEWCQDIYGPYTLCTQPDPCGPDTGSYRVVRGGSYDECNANSHLSVRRWHKPETSTEYIGFRIALTLPDDPMLQAQQEEEPPLSKSVKIKGKKVKFLYVPAEEPYYISEEIECALWRKMMLKEAPEKSKSVALGMSQTDRTYFAEYCSREAGEALAVASAEQIVLAEQLHIIEPFQPDVSHKRKKESTRSIQRKRRAADKLSPWTELVGVRLPKPDDPILLQFKKADDESRPLRLVIPTLPRNFDRESDRR